jgi:hypothetical protein
VALNWITTGDHLGHSLGRRHLWAAGGMDVLLLLGAALAAMAALGLRRRQAMQAAMLPAAVEKQHV